MIKRNAATPSAISSRFCNRLLSSFSRPTAMCSTPNLGTTHAPSELIKAVEVFFGILSFAMYFSVRDIDANFIAMSGDLNLLVSSP